MLAHVIAREDASSCPPSKNEGLVARSLLEARDSRYLYPIFIRRASRAAAMCHVPDVDAEAVAFTLEVHLKLEWVVFRDEQNIPP